MKGSGVWWPWEVPPGTASRFPQPGGASSSPDANKIYKMQCLDSEQDTMSCFDKDTCLVLEQEQSLNFEQQLCLIAGQDPCVVAAEKGQSLAVEKRMRFHTHMTISNPNVAFLKHSNIHTHSLQTSNPAILPYMTHKSLCRRCGGARDVPVLYSL